MADTVLVVAAHADDEALGCGGTMARHAAAGDAVHVAFMADGVGSRRGDDPDTEAARRNRARDQALQLLGVRSVQAFGWPDNAMDRIGLLDIVKPLEALIEKIAPDIVYTHHAGDLNIDHRLTQQAVMTACRPSPGSTVREILAFEVLSSTEWTPPGHAPFVPDVFIDIQAHWDAKRRALEAYADEMRPAPHSRSLAHVQALAVHRGHSVGLGLAEAFMLLRAVRR